MCWFRCYKWTFQSHCVQLIGSFHNWTLLCSARDCMVVPDQFRLIWQLSDALIGAWLWQNIDDAVCLAQSVFSNIHALMAYTSASNTLIYFPKAEAKLPHHTISTHPSPTMLSCVLELSMYQTSSPFLLGWNLLLHSPLVRKIYCERLSQYKFVSPLSVGWVFLSCFKVCRHAIPIRFGLPLSISVESINSYLGLSLQFQM
jgi:hypothetical protein